MDMSIRRVSLAALVAGAFAAGGMAEAQTLLSQQRPAVASSTENAGSPAANAVDGNTGTRWSSAFSDPQWIYVDLGATASVTRVVLTWEAAYGKSYQIQTSSDAATWTTVFTTTTGDGGTDDLAVSGSGRYVRMYGTARANGYGYSLWEFQVYGTLASATPTARPRATATSTGTATATSTARPTATATATATTGIATNLALGKPATASSSENAGTGPGLAVDGNAGTRWASAFSDPQWIAVDLGSTATVTRVRLSGEAAYGSAYQIQTSNDNATWTTIFTTTTGDGGVDDLTVSGSGRYVRMYGTARATGYGYSLWELEVYGTTGPTPTPRPTTPPPTPTATVVLGAIVPLYDQTTVLEPDTVIDTPTALITRISDRVRDRHARESQFSIYEHYISFYWEQRTVSIEIVDKVAKGGTELTFNITSLWQLNGPNLRTLFQGTGTVAQYMHNVVADGLDSTHYTHTMTYNEKTGAALKAGDRVEFEFSPFLLNQTNGRSNYYGTALLYVVGQGGLQPWQGIGTNTVDGVPSPDSFPLPASHRAGGGLTSHYNYSNEPANLFKQLGTNSSPASGQPFVLGRRLHHTDMGDGTHSGDVGITDNPPMADQIGKLGPHFYARKCIECHVNNGRSLPPTTGVTLTTEVTKVGTSTGAPDPRLGASLQPFSTNGAGEGSVNIGSYTMTSGTYADGTAYQLRKPNYAFTGSAPTNYSVRMTPPLVGMGLLEAVPEATIAALADPTDANGDGIRGRMQTVVDPQTSQTRLGRFGWKAGKARVSHQIASALNTDLGVTTSIFPNPDCGAQQTDCGPSGIELNDADLANWVRYISVLGVPARRDLNQGVQDTQSLQGESLFASAKCNACHTPTLTTGARHPFAELRNQTIHPYTDLLLHDMGAGLADNLGEGQASGADWRTAPLWSIGLTVGVSGGEVYLHDGRARTIEEAILWHGGEGATSQQAFRNMNAADRAALIKFLKSI
jgi:CxxC motif-containing protein (DUF1111 family)